MVYLPRTIETLAITAVFCAVALAVVGKAPPSFPAPVVAPQVQHSSAPAKAVQSSIPVEVLRVIDGDTVEVRAQIWLDQHITTKVRLRAIDAPELNAKCPNEAKMAKASRDHLTHLIGKGQVYLTELGRDKYGGRVVGHLLTQQGESVSTLLLEGGHARPYKGGKRTGWC